MTKALTNFDTVMERLSSGEVWDFPGGVHPDQRKDLSNRQKIAHISLPKSLHIPIKQHIGVDGEIIVNVGDKVLKGQPLTRSENPFAVPVHASSSGTVVDISEHPSAHPSAIPELSIHIDLDGEDRSCDFEGIKDYVNASKSELIEAICQAGISGMGGAGFPTHLKSNNVKPTEFLIINGIECEPYISSDDRLMREHAWQIRQGIDVLCKILEPKQVIVAVEDNKPEALETMAMACQQPSNYQVISIPTKYPAGGEKQLIQVLTGREVPADGLPIDIACLMYNVGTCYAIADAVIEGKPLVERVVTLTGEAMETPQNVWARIGTPIKHLLEQAKFDVTKQSHPQIIMGGPMMGFTLASSKITVIKTTNCILAPAKGELPELDAERPCIRCSACADACPVSLLPQQMFWYSQSKQYDEAEDYNLFDCIECGACAYVCPSEIPLVHYYRKAKSDIRQQKFEKEQAEKARVRFEARKERLEAEKQAREARHKKAAEARKQAMQKDGGKAQDKIAAALARAKAKKAAMQQSQADEPNSVTSNNGEQAKSHSSVTLPQSDPSVEDKTAADDKKAKVAAAIARAKAKKALAKKESDSDVNKTFNDEQQTKANLDAQSSAPKDEVKIEPNQNNEPELPAKAKNTQEQNLEKAEVKNAKKEKVAAAIARAKAKKLEREQAQAKGNLKSKDVNE